MIISLLWFVFKVSFYITLAGVCIAAPIGIVGWIAEKIAKRKEDDDRG